MKKDVKLQVSDHKWHQYLIANFKKNQSRKEETKIIMEGIEVHKSFYDYLNEDKHIIR